MDSVICYITFPLPDHISRVLFVFIWTYRSYPLKGNQFISFFWGLIRNKVWSRLAQVWSCPCKSSVPLSKDPPSQSDQISQGCQERRLQLWFASSHKSCVDRRRWSSTSAWFLNSEMSYNTNVSYDVPCEFHTTIRHLAFGEPAAMDEPKRFKPSWNRFTPENSQVSWQFAMYGNVSHMTFWVITGLNGTLQIMFWDLANIPIWNRHRLWSWYHPLHWLFSNIPWIWVCSQPGSPGDATPLSEASCFYWRPVLGKGFANHAVGTEQ